MDIPIEFERMEGDTLTKNINKNNNYFCFGTWNADNLSISWPENWNYLNQKLTEDSNNSMPRVRACTRTRICAHTRAHAYSRSKYINNYYYNIKNYYILNPYNIIYNNIPIRAYAYAHTRAHARLRFNNYFLWLGLGGGIGGCMGEKGEDFEKKFPAPSPEPSLGVGGSVVDGWEAGEGSAVDGWGLRNFPLTPPSPPLIPQKLATQKPEQKPETIDLPERAENLRLQPGMAFDECPIPTEAEKPASGQNFQKERHSSAGGDTSSAHDGKKPSPQDGISDSPSTQPRPKQDISLGKKIVINLLKNRLPKDWEPDEAGMDFASSKNLDVFSELERFRAYHEAKGSLMADWDAAWRGWCLNAEKYRQERGIKASPSYRQNGNSTKESSDFDGDDSDRIEAKLKAMAIEEWGEEDDAMVRTATKKHVPWAVKLLDRKFSPIEIMEMYIVLYRYIQDAHRKLLKKGITSLPCGGISGVITRYFDWLENQTWLTNRTLHLLDPNSRVFRQFCEEWGKMTGTDPLTAKQII